MTKLLWESSIFELFLKQGAHNHGSNMDLGQLWLCTKFKRDEILLKISPNEFTINITPPPFFSLYLVQTQLPVRIDKKSSMGLPGCQDFCTTGVKWGDGDHLSKIKMSECNASAQL